MFFEFSEANISTIFGYMTNLFADFSPIIFIILGLAIAFWIIKTIIEITTGRKVDEFEEE